MCGHHCDRPPAPASVPASIARAMAGAALRAGAAHTRCGECAFRAALRRRIRLGACAPSPDARSVPSATRPVTRQAPSVPLLPHFARATAAFPRTSCRVSVRFATHERIVAAFCIMQCRGVPASRALQRLGPDRLYSCHMSRSTAKPLSISHPTHRGCRAEKRMPWTVTTTLQYAVLRCSMTSVMTGALERENLIEIRSQLSEYISLSVLKNTMKYARSAEI